MATPKNPSLRKAVTAALAHVTPESRVLAAVLDLRNRLGITEREHEYRVLHPDSLPHRYEFGDQ